MFVGAVSSSALLSPGRETAALQINPANVPTLEIKLGALVVLLSITLLFGFAPLCIVRGAGRCNVDPGKEQGVVRTRSGCSALFVPLIHTCRCCLHSESEVM